MTWSELSAGIYAEYEKRSGGADDSDIMEYEVKAGAAIDSTGSHANEVHGFSINDSSQTIWLV